MWALIIGAGGFVGGYLIRELSSRYWEVTATKLPQEKITEENFAVRDLDILNEVAISVFLADVKPDFFRLAAQSSAALSWKNPALTVNINIKGSVNLLEAVRNSGLSPRLILIGSADEYGCAANMDVPVDENVAPDLGNIYAVTKYTPRICWEGCISVPTKWIIYRSRAGSAVCGGGFLQADGGDQSGNS